MTPERDDPILDVLLEETLHGVSPPDLSARILQAWAARGVMDSPGARNGRPAMSELLPPAVTAAPSNVPLAVPAPHSPVIVTGRKSRRSRHSWTGWLTTGAIGAAMALAVIVVLRQVSTGPVAAKPVKPVKEPSRGAIAKRPDFAKPAPPKPPQYSKPVVQPAPPATQDAPQFAADDKQTPPKSLDNNPPATPSSPTIEPTSPREIITYINTQFAGSWKDNAVTPAPAATDPEWCRRVFLRVLGRIPTVEELDSFTKDKRADRRERLVDRLLDSSEYSQEFTRQWGATWTNVLIGRTAGTEKGDPVSREGLQQFLTTAMDKNVPYDRLVRELLTAEGGARPGDENYHGGVNFFLAGYTEDATLATSRIARLFLGVNLQCAQCHNHPTNQWDQRDYWSLNAFLRQIKVEKRGLQAKLVDQDLAARRGDVSEAEVYYQTPSGLMKAAFPRFIDGREIPRDGEVAHVDRRERLADFIVRSPEMPRAFMNRLWSQFFGYGFTRPVDDIGAGNPPSQPEVLDRLSQEFAAHGFNVRSAMKWIVLSEPFGRSSKVAPGGVADAPEAGGVPLFSRYYTRQMQVEEVYDSLLIAAKMRKSNGGAGGGNGEGLVARRDWTAQFARPMATDDAAEETTFDGNIRQSIIMMTGDLMQRVTNPHQEGMLQSVAKSPLKFEEKVEHLFLAAVSRKPLKKEMDAARTIAAANKGDETSTLQDLWWALLNSNEFILDH